MENKEQNNYDFYAYGIRVANDVFENSKKIADSIKKEYGEDAKLQFECGFSIQLEKNSINQIEKINLKSKDTSLGSNIITKEDYRNNSYFGTEGISKKVDAEGNYQEPKIKKLVL